MDTSESSDVIDFSWFPPLCGVGLFGFFEISSTDSTKVARASA
jgi:hypothetical protein